MRYIGSTLYLALSMIAWGSITVGMAFVRNAPQLLATRFLLVSERRVSRTVSSQTFIICTNLPGNFPVKISD